jgi:Cu(I)/Ag(I) efflux system membrane fusion protein
MNRLVIAIVMLAVGVLTGLYFGRHAGDQPSPEIAGDPVGRREILYWVAPMDPNFRRDEPGKSPMGMDLVPVYADEVDNQPGVVRIEPGILANLGVRTSPAARSSLPRIIDTVGYVTYDEESLQHIHTRVEGWIERLSVSATGDPVTEGQRLFELYSPTLVNAQEEFLVALRSGNASLVRASRERLTALGLSAREVERIASERQVSQRVRYYADADGVVAGLAVRDGMYVTPATEVLAVASLDEVWVVAEVFERQSQWVRPGQPATVSLDALPGIEFAGVVDYVYPELDPVTRTLRVRLRFDNTSGQLRPNMYARVRIAGRETGPIVHVPKEAVVRGGDVDRVVVALGGGRFKSVPVRVGIESGDRVAIRQGIEEGEPVVVSAQFLIDSESNVSNALERLTGTPPDATDAKPEHGDHDMDGLE